VEVGGCYVIASSYCSCTQAHVYIWQQGIKKVRALELQLKTITNSQQCLCEQCAVTPHDENTHTVISSQSVTVTVISSDDKVKDVLRSFTQVKVVI